jgi:hypothetical protein
MYSMSGRTCIDVAAIHKIGQVLCDLSVTGFEFFIGYGDKINLYTPNVNYSWRTAPLTTKVAFCIFIQQI